MIDWKELFPLDALMPLLGGALIWFGLNYLVIAPTVLGPRLAETYYMPACIAAVASGKTVAAQKLVAADTAFAAGLEDYRKRAAAAVSQGAAQGLAMLFGGYGKEGQAFLNTYGNQLGGMTSGPAKMAIEQEVQKQRAQYAVQRRAMIEALQAKVRFSGSESFCGCNVTQGYADRVQLAAFTSTLRLYKPENIAQLERGEIIGEACGAPPVI